MTSTSRRAHLAPAALLLSVIASCGAESSVRSPPSSAPSAVCADPINDPGHCAHELKDSHQRTGAPAIGQDEALDEAAVAVFNTARLDGTGLEATEEYVTRVQRALTEKGYTGAVVRLARPEDPSVPGALLWAVRVGDVCVLGDVVPGPDGRWHEWYAGLLPGGRCLTA
ncbi:hypothetical protein AB0M02_36180 [Actinoplanes sp. NPDC051861]|uniref:hypothetical protein n=1 Tax=Actinoplanes sp. NPDC051861 TaxID=3155170 RepID=UPI00342406C7